MSRRRIAALAALALAACAAPAHAPRPSPSPLPMLIESRGIVMPLAQARANIAFAPFIPPGRVLAVAAIPPLGGSDSRRTHGIALEYEKTGRRMLLSQWPLGELRINAAGWDAVHRPCAPIAFKADGLLWATRNGLVMTLQPDGAVSGPHLASESRGLLGASHCLRR
ncbi:MAG: hypothetical protein ABR508_02095 [Candidatus Baltobacteraceae bacterium]